MSGFGRGKEAVLPAWMTNPALYGKEIPKNGGAKEIKYARQVYIKDNSNDEKIHKNQSHHSESHHRLDSRSRSRSPPIPFVKIPPRPSSASNPSENRKRYRSPTPPRSYKRRPSSQDHYDDVDSVYSQENRRRNRGGDFDHESRRH